MHIESVSIQQFIEVISTLPEDKPHGNPRVWYRTQKEHWLGWLRDYSGPGAYDRKNSDRDAKYVYNHIANPGMLLWLITAAGVSSELMLTMGQALAATPDARTHVGIIRKHVPWSVVASKLWKA